MTKKLSTSPPPHKKQKVQTTQNLNAWLEHNDKSYHDFSNETALAIKTSLLQWYRKSRRKLPWRGDPPPYDGSTASFPSKKNQSKLDSFFLKSKSQDKTKIQISGYSIWVSEIMLQQTRVEAVIPYYLKWMKSFPTLQKLANATSDEVNAHWAGLGFYRRARMLHEGSKYVLQHFNGVVPSTVEDLMTIPGIGRYTASAISSIAYDQCVPVVDGNVCRVLSRLTGIANHIKAPIFKDKLGWDLAAQIVQAGDGKYASEVNQALMELGSTYCAPSGTGVDKNDPLREFYLSTTLGKEFALAIKDDFKIPISKCELCSGEGIGMVLQKLSSELKTNPHVDPAKVGHACFPIDPPKKQKRQEIYVINVYQYENQYLMIKRPSTGLLANQWEFPSKCVWSCEASKVNQVEIPNISLKERNKALESLNDDYFENIHTKLKFVHEPLEHIFSHIRHIMYVHYIQVDSNSFNCNSKSISWMSEMDMSDVGVTAGVKKVLTAIKKIT